MIKFKKKYLFCNLTTNYLIVPYLLIFQNPIHIDYTVLLLRKSIIINHSLMMENIPIQKEPFLSSNHLRWQCLNHIFSYNFLFARLTRFCASHSFTRSSL